MTSLPLCTGSSHVLAKVPYSHLISSHPLSIPTTLLNLRQWAPLCRGHLARPPSEFGNTTRSAGDKASQSTIGTVEPDITIIKRVQELAEKKGWKMSHVAL